MLRLVLLVSSAILIGYNGPYLWWVEARDIPRALANPLDGPIRSEHVRETTQSYRAHAFRSIGPLAIRDWATTRGGIPVGESGGGKGGVALLVSWKPKTTLDDTLAEGAPAGLLYHPGYLERFSLPELGTRLPIAILRIGTYEQLEDFYRTRWHARMFFIVVLALFSINALRQMTASRRR